MSTRCQIGVYESKDQELSKWSVLLYKHSDGYPDNILPLLIKYMKQFYATDSVSLEDKNYVDASYLSAWLIWFLIEEHRDIMRDYHSQYEDHKLYKFDPTVDFLGHGISDDIQGDIEYYYALYPNRIEVYDTHFEDEMGNWELIETITEIQ